MVTMGKYKKMQGIMKSSRFGGRYECQKHTTIFLLYNYFDFWIY